MFLTECDAFKLDLRGSGFADLASLILVVETRSVASRLQMTKLLATGRCTV